MNLYNEEFKDEYISKFDNESTQKAIRNIFKNSFSTELILEKDLYDFSNDEIGNLIRGFAPFDKYMAYDLGKQIARYIDYAIICGRTIAENPISALTPDWYETLVDKKHKLFSKDEIYSLVERLINSQDKAMIALIFEGVTGKLLSELRNIKLSDVNEFLNLVTLRNDDREIIRIIKVTDWCMEQIKSAFSDVYYQTIKDNSEKQLVEFNDYLFRNFQNRSTSKTGSILSQTLYGRIQNISGVYDIPFLRPKAILKSGMIAMAVRLLEDNGHLGKKQLEEISDQFDYGKFYQDAYKEKVINVSYMKRTINEKEIKKLYDINVNID
jgi:integrase